MVKSMNPRISVVIPVYNGELFVAKAIESVLNQSYPAHEIIVIDDGSTDDTPKILERFKDKIISKRIKNTGSPSTPRNIAMRMATGDYIAFLDADDVWFKNKLINQVEFILMYPNAGFFCCDFVERRSDQHYKLKRHFSLLRSLEKINFDTLLKPTPFELLIEENFVGGASTVVIKKEIIDKLGGFYGDAMYGEDYEYWLRCATITDFVLVSDVLMYKRTHADNITYDRIVLHVRHGDALRKIVRNMNSYIVENGLLRKCQLSLASNYYDLGNNYFEAKKIKQAFNMYFIGMLSHKSIVNFASFSWVVFKKLMRFVTFSIVIKENADIRKSLAKYKKRWKVENRLLKLKNYYYLLSYMIRNRKFEGTIPILSSERKSFENLLLFLLDNAIKYRFDEEVGYFRKGSTLQRSPAGKQSDIYELMSRTFIGVGYYLIHNNSDDLRKKYLTLIKNGCCLESKSYWGKIVSDQRVVENTSVIVGLLLNKEKLWDALPQKEKRNFLGYILASSRKHFRQSNWLWFKVFHFLILEKYGGVNYKEQIISTIEKLSKFYTGDGWYNDSLQDNEYRYDHYNSWAMHYYGLLFCYLAGDEYRGIKEILKERFRLFKHSYLLCFSDKGLPIPWGRSLLYRFGMLSCFGLGIKLDLIDKNEMAKIKKITVSTINEFFHHRILDCKGLLTMGFTKVSKQLLENYSSDGSPYWALKAFSFLILDENHAFWNMDISDSVAEEEKDVATFIPAINAYIRHDKNGHLFLLNGIMNSRIYPYKYNRFAYSNIFFQTIDRKFVDHAFVFLYRGENLIRDIIKEVKYTKTGAIHVRWAVSKIKGLEVYTSIISIKYGYILINNIVSPETIKYIFCGFNSKTGNLSIRKKESSIKLDCDNLSTKLQVVDLIKGKIGYKLISNKLMFYKRSSVVPYYTSKVIPGKTTVIMCVQASRGQNIDTPIIVKEKASVVIKGQVNGMGELNLKERDFFYG